MVDHSAMKLGRLPVRHDDRVPLFSAYLVPTLPPAPVTMDWSKGLKSWGMMDNDTLGDCTAAGIGHAYQTWTDNVAGLWTPVNQQVVQFYSETTGYVVGDPSTDQGGVEADVLAYLLKFGFCGRHILGYASINPLVVEHFKQGVALTGGVYTGVSLPLIAQTQELWDAPADLIGDAQRGSWGGHAMWCCAYNEVGPIFVTWGELKQATWAWWAAYSDECYAIVADDWIRNGTSPGGIKLADLMVDMNILRKVA